MVYERITRKLRYSLIRFSYLIFALCFRSICETAEKNVPLNMIKKNVLFISLHHPDSDQNDQDADDVLKRKIFVKNDHSPYLGPQKIDAFVGVGRGKRKFFDHLLPCNGVDSTVCDHKKKKYIEKRTVKPFFIIINRCKLGKNAGKRKQQDIQMKLNIIFDFCHVSSIS